MSLVPVVYRSTDVGAPVLTGQAGSLLALLDAVLVVGYGSGPTAKPGLGWTIEYSGTNIRAYRNNPVTGTGYNLRIDDAAGSLLGARIATVYGAQSIDSGTGVATNLVPTAAQVAAGIAWEKSATANATARPWLIIGTERDLYIYTAPNSDVFVPHMALDLRSSLPVDNHSFCVGGSNTFSATNLAGSSVFRTSNGPITSLSTVSWPIYVARDVQMNVGAISCCHPADETSSSGNITNNLVLGHGNAVNPHPDSGGLILKEPYIASGINRYRGRLPGVLTSFSVPVAAHDKVLPAAGPQLEDLLCVLVKPARTIPGMALGMVLHSLDVEWH